MSDKNLYKKTFFLFKKTCTPDFTTCYNQYADAVDIKSCCKVKRLRTFKKRCQTDSKFETDLSEWSL